MLGTLVVMLQVENTLGLTWEGEGGSSHTLPQPHVGRKTFDNQSGRGKKDDYKGKDKDKDKDIERQRQRKIKTKTKTKMVSHL